VATTTQVAPSISHGSDSEFTLGDGVDLNIEMVYIAVVKAVDKGCWWSMQYES
jgi:hypothetical protein